MFSILVAEDDDSLRKLMCAALKQNGYMPYPAVDGEDALDVMERISVDLVISDIMMPKIDGYELVKQLRAARYEMPVLMVTAKDSFTDKQKGFMAGTDDYMVKPINIDEMILRVGALLRRAKMASDHALTVGSCTLNYDALTVTFEGKPPETIPNKEFMLLFKLLSYPNKIFTRR